MTKVVQALYAQIGSGRRMLSRRSPAQGLHSQLLACCRLVGCADEVRLAAASGAATCVWAQINV